MPFDFRRIQAPENSEDYNSFVIKGKKQNDKLIDKNGKREDGRDKDEIRKIYLKTGVVSQAKGSAYIEMGDTKVICSVFDPREKVNRTENTNRGKLYCEFKFASFSSKKRRGHILDNEDKEYSNLLKNALEPAVCLHEFPNFQVDVNVLVIQDDGASLAAAITCASLALADAAVPMYDLAVGACKGIYGDIELMDPTLKEEEILSNTSNENKDYILLTVGLLPTFNQVSQMVHVGNSTSDKLEKCLNSLISIGSEIHKAVQYNLLHSVKKQFKFKQQESDELSKSLNQTKITS